MLPSHIDNPLLTVVIATKDRQKYAKVAIESIMADKESDISIVVQDNSASTELEKWCRRYSHNRQLVYRREPTPLSFIGNFNQAAELVTGEYVCFIGDDDTITKQLIEVVRWAKKENIDAINFGGNATYLWPGTGVQSTVFTAVRGGSLYINKSRGASKILARKEINQELRLLLKNGGLYYLNHNLPRLYHGVVSRRSLEKIKTQCGTYFGGLSPDTFASLALACVVESLCVLNDPLTLPGACKESGSVQEGSLKRRSTRLEDAPHLKNRGNYTWSQTVPRLYTVETIWVDSSLAALNQMGRKDLVAQLNIGRLAAHCIGSNVRLSKQILLETYKCFKISESNIVGGLGNIFIGLLVGPLRRQVIRLINRIKIILLRDKTFQRHDNLPSIIEAKCVLEDYLERFPVKLPNRKKPG